MSAVFLASILRERERKEKRAQGEEGGEKKKLWKYKYWWVGTSKVTAVRRAPRIVTRRGTRADQTNRVKQRSNSDVDRSIDRSHFALLSRHHRLLFSSRVGSSNPPPRDHHASNTHGRSASCAEVSRLESFATELTGLQEQSCSQLALLSTHRQQWNNMVSGTCREVRCWFVEMILY